MISVMRCCHIASALCTVFLCIVDTVLSNTSGQDIPLLPKPAPTSLSQFFDESDKRRIWIQREIDALTPEHAWAGIYFWGDEHDAIRFYIAPQAGFDYRWTGGGGWFDMDYGSVEVDGEVLKLHPHFQHDKYTQWLVSDPYYAIHWGTRHYLIPKNQLVAFCNAINAHNEPRTHRYGEFFLREGDEHVTIEGLPTLPESYRSYILPSPLSVTILDSVGKIEIDGMPVILLTINAGWRDGVYPGMRLYAIDHENGQWLDILRVEEQTSTGAFLQAFEEFYPRPGRGWQFSTLPAWNRE